MGLIGLLFEKAVISCQGGRRQDIVSEPKRLRQQPGFAHPTAATEVVEIPIDLLNRVVKTGISEVGYHICFNMAPQMIHGIELGAGNGEPSQ
jgi:hypothetical protein